MQCRTLSAFNVLTSFKRLSYKMDYIIEVLGFRDSHNKFVLNEVAVVALGKEYIAHWVAAVPHSFSDLPIKIQVYNN